MEPPDFTVPGLPDIMRLAIRGELAELSSRAASLVSSLPAHEAPDARRVLAIAGSVVAATEAAFEDPANEANVAVRIELRGLSERLGRRSAEGIPFASLARALSATLHGNEADALWIRRECDGQLATFGL